MCAAAWFLAPKGENQVSVLTSVPHPIPSTLHTPPPPLFSLPQSTVFRSWLTQARAHSAGSGGPPSSSRSSAAISCGPSPSSPNYTPSSSRSDPTCGRSSCTSSHRLPPTGWREEEGRADRWWVACGATKQGGQREKGGIDRYYAADLYKHLVHHSHCRRWGGKYHKGFGLSHSRGFIPVIQHSSRDRTRKTAGCPSGEVEEGMSYSVLKRKRVPISGSVFGKTRTGR